MTRRMSVGSILGAACFPVISYFMQPEFVWYLESSLAVIILVKHRANIVQTLQRGRNR